MLVIKHADNGFLFRLCFGLDVDECMEDNGGCDDTCSNHDGGYTCGCTIEGFELREETACVGTMNSYFYSFFSCST